MNKSRYFISLLWMYLCSCKHIMSMLWSIAEAVSSGSWPIPFKVHTLSVAICIVLLHFSNFCLSLSSVADFRTLEPGLQPQQDSPLSYPRVERRDLDVWFESELWLSFDSCAFILIHRSHPYRWAAIQQFDLGRCPTGFVYPAPG